MKIVGWAQSTAGQGRYRVGMPMWALGLAGHETYTFDPSNASFPADADVLVGQIVFDDERTAVWQEIATLSDRPALVLEIDDDPWSVEPDNPAYEHFSDATRHANLIRNLEVADAVTVTTEHLAEIMGHYNEHVTVIPNCVDIDLLRRPRPENKQVTVGWAGGFSHKLDFYDAGGELRRFFRKNPRVQAHLIGTDYRGVIGRPHALFTPWENEFSAYYRNLTFDIGIAPLRRNEFNASKSDLKFLEFSALGIPTVATDWGPYSESIEHGVTGFLVSTPSDWGRYLRLLVNDAALREQISWNARKWAATRTLQGNYGRWELVYAQALARVRGNEVPQTLDAVAV